MTMRYAALLPLLMLCALRAGAQQRVIPLWPQGTPEPAQTTQAEVDVTRATDALIGGHRSRRFTNVTVPTLSVYAPAQGGNGTAALVLPGGGYVRLAWDGEGIDTCEWLNAAGITCLLLKYRVPEQGRYPENAADLEDAQQAVRLARAHAAEWHLAPNRIGVVGFSAGGNLAVLLSTHPDDRHVEATPAAAQVNAAVSAQVNFAIVVYPAYLGVEPAETALDPVYQPNGFTPPTFLLQAADDAHYAHNALLYYRALMDAHVPAELHYYATGGHGFGVHPAGVPEQTWTTLANQWLRSIHMMGNGTDGAAKM